MVDDSAPIAAITTTGLAERLDGCELLVIDINDPRIDRLPGYRTAGARIRTISPT